MRKPAKIFVVIEESGDGYHSLGKNLIAWFFDEREAEDWAEVRRGTKGDYTSFYVEEVPGGTWE
jgi:hypothetical protein